MLSLLNIIIEVFKEQHTAVELFETGQVSAHDFAKIRSRILVLLAKFVELELIFKKIILDLNNKPALLKQRQDSFVTISRMDLLGKLYYPSEG